MRQALTAMVLTILYLVTAAASLPTAESAAWFYATTVLILTVEQRVQFAARRPQHAHT